MAKSHWRCHRRSFALRTDLLMLPFWRPAGSSTGLSGLCTCFLMTVLMETHLIPNPHLNLFLSRMTVTHTHTHRGATRQHFPELLPHGSLVGTPAVSMVLPLLSFRKKKQSSRWKHGIKMFRLLCFSKLMKCRKWGAIVGYWCNYCETEDWFCLPYASTATTYSSQRRRMSGVWANSGTLQSCGDYSNGLRACR